MYSKDLNQDSINKNAMTVFHGFTISFKNEEEVDAVCQRLDKAVKKLKKNKTSPRNEAF